MTSQTTSQWSFGSLKSVSDNVNGPMDSFASSNIVSNIFSGSESILQFNRGVEEGSKFLPSNNQLIIDVESYTFRPELKEGSPEVLVKVEKDDVENSPNGPRGRKNHQREDSNFEEERSSKQSAAYVEEDELCEMFDRYLLCTDETGQPGFCDIDEEEQIEVTKASQRNGQPNGSSGGKTRAKKQGNKKKVVDLRTLLINCAQSVIAGDSRTANEQLKQIRQHSSPSGDGSQRLADVFANCLEARLAGTGSQIYAALASKRMSAVDTLKAYQLYLSACPFMKFSIFFANRMIADLAMKSAKKKLHIIDFGILHGFQWPILVQHLSCLPGGPPELRITGIEMPLSGFRPAELVEETGRRLAKYCERFKVQFQYHAIARKWETIKIEDLNIFNDEVLAVNCLFRFKNLLDDTVAENSPRDAVLKLIRKMNPDIFVHTVVNGSYNIPFFVTRFREALFHYSSLFDMIDNNMPREDQQRTIFEQEFYGREIMNVIACEGSERVERPETYKQWQARNMRAGFRILTLKQELVKKARGKVKRDHHKDFMIDEDGQWLLQGWKGRIFCASSCWVIA
ncbi:Scarecrow-like protein [Actinidia chinensis var. chinensis]|uniref:Scarecrow-like protein n=1 Tax=Actinidia chinensis var. chinensis TaxID=1590841 RepID=A0A2R6P7Z2_ACTCC|nr:Scarecrow-like protein [Actinidia chinensis var. chinensis]